MATGRFRRSLRHALVAAFAVAVTALPAAASTSGTLDPGTRFYVPPPDTAAVRQTLDLARAGQVTDALELGAMLAQGHAVWFTGGTPQEVRKAVAQTMLAAKLQHRVPVLVAYDLPYRDCAQYSAGGALDTASYLAWIAGFAKGIGDGRAIVILEPDGLGLIPYYAPFGATGMEWCQPKDADGNPSPGASPEARFEQLNGAVDRLEQQPNAAVYLDGTHSDWLGVGDAADRLVKAGVERAQGFFLNVSNYQYASNSVQYGTWISQCIASGDYADCADKYWNGGPEGTKITDLLGPWQGVSLSPYGEWSDDSDVPELNTSGINARVAGVVGTTHFVVDTGRDGAGPWQPPAGAYSDPQAWCNPPDRGAGLRPTADTGNPLVDAYLWIKVPGESDGACLRGTAGPEDPERGMVDPPAGQWFPEQALELAKLAQPPLLGH